MFFFSHKWRVCIYMYMYVCVHLINVFNIRTVISVWTYFKIEYFPIHVTISIQSSRNAIKRKLLSYHDVCYECYLEQWY